MSSGSSARRILVVMGHPTILKEHAGEAKAFYSMLGGFLTARGFLPSFRSPLQPLEGIADAAYLIGHSRGAKAIVASYSPATHPRVLGIALFDPNFEDREKWNSWSLPRVVFVSRYPRGWWVEGWRKAVYLRDGHYFLRSFQRIQEELVKLIG